MSSDNEGNCEKKKTDEENIGLSEDDISKKKNEEKEDLDDLSSDNCNNQSKQKNKNDNNKFEMANGNLHFLPAKLNYSRKASVDIYFETNIEIETEKSKRGCKNSLNYI